MTRNDLLHLIRIVIEIIAYGFICYVAYDKYSELGLTIALIVAGIFITND